MPWNHRVRKIYFENIDSEIEEWFDIVECYYETDEDADNNRSGGYTQDGIQPGGSDLSNLKWELEHMLLALDKPVIVEDKVIPHPFKDRKKNTNAEDE